VLCAPFIFPDGILGSFEGKRQFCAIFRQTPFLQKNPHKGTAVYEQMAFLNKCSDKLVLKIRLKKLRSNFKTNNSLFLFIV